MSPLHVCVEWWSVKIMSGAGNGGRFDVYDCVILFRLWNDRYGKQKKEHCDVGLAASTMMDAHDQLEQQKKNRGLRMIDICIYTHTEKTKDVARIAYANSLL
ncbi:hypothetical protein OUZ56_030777 [Daphnia magna]|uniref:Uncharacterized protein n=1 Tax=Daphnia magna TaxID=35525 RepID=A0ABQ9ZSP7_9CRUS|nr:hypothetical protein OUZ56_030777 [Daphnia magna]